ncbi:hypothetical protein GQ44DRAFT_736854 [Phaeosphaeriaceae sp. PMI808]|nr:hypothetical protein GQ44DRAFT_736854 [Phaeosphaeriaceae sp. PMI808]
MAPGIDMGDRNAWDDSYLLNSWNDAVKEYEKYHSIHKSGKRLEDALTTAELKELREDYGDDIEEAEETSDAAEDSKAIPDQDDTEMTHVETDGVGNVAQDEEPNPSEQQQEQPLANEENPAGTSASFMPQAILDTVQDENMKNIMMSWYYAGYYTGLHAGQQQTPNGNVPK